MSLRNQPYLPLYIQDFQTDEKLMECSAAATGVYIRILCILHKTDNYGEILLRQKDKQSDKQIKNFALKFAKFLPYTDAVVFAAVEELVDAGVLIIDGDRLFQKRMVKDAELSIKRSLSGKLGGDSNKERLDNFAKAKPKAKGQANAEYESEYENEVLNNTQSTMQVVRNSENENSKKNGENISFSQAKPSGVDILAARFVPRKPKSEPMRGEDS